MRKAKHAESFNVRKLFEAAIENSLDDLKEKVRSINEVQAIFGVSKRTLYNWNKEGVLPARKVGGKIYYTQSDIDFALERSKKVETTDNEEESK